MLWAWRACRRALELAPPAVDRDVEPKLDWLSDSTRSVVAENVNAVAFCPHHKQDIFFLAATLACS